jgi:hypothetical protein
MSAAVLAGRAIVAIAWIAMAGLATDARGRATRTWVSGVGDDANPCSRTAPCKTFAGAISKTAANGEISVLDPGGFGAVTITKDMTIDGGGIEGSILGALVTGVIVDAGANDVVILRNLSINGAGTGINGIRFIAGSQLHVENVHVARFGGGGGMTGNGIDFNPSGPASLHVRDSSFRHNGLIGILVRPLGTGSANVSLFNVHLEENGAGFFQSDGATTTIAHTTSTGNSGASFQVQASGVLSSLQLDRVISSNNGTFGVRTDGALANIRLSNSAVTSNGNGAATGGGTINSFQNNAVHGNGSDGAGALPPGDPSLTRRRRAFSRGPKVRTRSVRSHAGSPPIAMPGPRFGYGRGC